MNNMKMAKRFLMICISFLMLFLVNTTCIPLISYASETVTDDNDRLLTFNSVIEVENVEVENGYLEAGKETNILLTIHNANQNTPANSILVVFNSNSGMIYPRYGTDNQYYVGTLTAGSSKIIKIPVIVSSDLSGDYVDLRCDLIYESHQNRISNSVNMVLPTQNISNIVVNSLDISAHATKNSKSLLSMNYANNSAGNINDAKLTIEGNVNESTSSIDLGTILSNKSYSKDFNIIFTESGEQTIGIKLSYTDINGESIDTDLGIFKVNVGEENENALNMDSENKLFVWIGRCLAIIALCCVVVVAYIYIKKR